MSRAGRCEGPLPAGGGVQALGFPQCEALLSKFLASGVEQPLGTKLSDSPSRKHYLAQKEQLQAKALAGRITVPERVNWSAYLIRLRQYQAAVQVLESVAAQELQNFMVFANLATAHQLAGSPERALAYLQQCRLLRPDAWPGFTKPPLDWLARVEKYHLGMVK